MIEQTITIGNIIEITVIAMGGVSVFATMRTTVKNINDKVDTMQLEIKKLGDILIQIARTDLRLTRLEEDYRDLRKGRGWILPPEETS